MGSTHRSGAWIRHYHKGAADGVRLVCFPHAGGSASYYFPWSMALSPAIEVLSVQYPGRQERRLERPIDSVHELADRIAPALVEWIDRPTALFGHSMGATLAFEVARRIERDTDTKLITLFASGRRAPSRLRDDDVHLRDDAGMVAELRRLSGTDSVLLEDADLLRMVLPALRADYKAIETYRMSPNATVRCPVAVLVGDADPEVTLGEARAWGEHTSGGTDLHVFSGDHFYLSERKAEVLGTVAQTIRARLGTPAGADR